MIYGVEVIYNGMLVCEHDDYYSLTFEQTPQVLNNTLITSSDDPFNAILILSAGKL